MRKAVRGSTKKTIERNTKTRVIGRVRNLWRRLSMCWPTGTLRESLIIVIIVVRKVYHKMTADSHLRVEKRSLPQIRAINSAILFGRAIDAFRSVCGHLEVKSRAG